MFGLYRLIGWFKFDIETKLNAKVVVVFGDNLLSCFADDIACVVYFGEKEFQLAMNSNLAQSLYLA